MIYDNKNFEECETIDTATHWQDDSSGYFLEMDKFYGFSDSGGVWSSIGHSTAEECRAALAQENLPRDFVEGSDFSFKTEDLGAVSCSIIRTRDLIAFWTAQCEIHARMVKPGEEIDKLSNYGALFRQTV